MEVWFYSFLSGCFYSISNELDLEKVLLFFFWQFEWRLFEIKGRKNDRVKQRWRVGGVARKCYFLKPWGGDLCNAQPLFLPPPSCSLFIWKVELLLIVSSFLFPKSKSVCEQKCTLKFLESLSFYDLENTSKGIFFFFVTLFIKYSNDCKTVSKIITAIRSPSPMESIICH